MGSGQSLGADALQDLTPSSSTECTGRVAMGASEVPYLSGRGEYGLGWEA